MYARDCLEARPIAMKRIPEDELMENHYQVKAYSEADFSSSDKAFLHSLEGYLSSLNKYPFHGTRFVDLGCGPGNITELLAKRWPLSSVIGIDGSEAMLDIARCRKNEYFGDTESIRYENIDISLLANKTTNIGFEADVVVSNSFLHHLHHPAYLWKAIKNLAVPGTIFFHRDLRRPLSPFAAIDLQQKHLPNAPLILIKDFLASLHAAFTVDEVKAQLLSEEFQHFHVTEVGDRYLQVIGSV